MNPNDDVAQCMTLCRSRTTRLLLRWTSLLLHCCCSSHNQVRLHGPLSPRAVLCSSSSTGSG